MSLLQELEEVIMQSQITTMDKAGSVVLDIEGLSQPPDKCCGSPKVTKALSRKGSWRMDRSGEGHDVDEAPKKLVVKVAASQLEQLKQPFMQNKVLIAVQSSATNSPIADSGDGKGRRFKSIHPRRILLFFATVSSMGTMILIYFTLAINQRGGE
ncbi:uncharacterized protein M6B38_343895 [Iris pallida]|uniref:Uncharacterized protein n=1 Tax=Iris pallida TaxID=29817 RepID=A0AAX6GUR3_IRIPA|nr:uncharacterized protein M6B38_343895 [Iris pallida]